MTDAPKTKTSLITLSKSKPKPKPKGGLGSPPPPPPTAAPSLLAQPESPGPKARTKTRRTAQFTTRVTPEFLAEFQAVAFARKLKLVEVLEKSFEAFKKDEGLRKDFFDKYQ